MGSMTILSFVYPEITARNFKIAIDPTLPCCCPPKRFLGRPGTWFRTPQWIIKCSFRCMPRLGAGVPPNISSTTGSWSSRLSSFQFFTPLLRTRQHTQIVISKRTTVDIQIYQDFPDITSLVFIKTNHVSIKISFLLIEFILNKITGSH